MDATPAAPVPAAPAPAGSVAGPGRAPVRVAVALFLVVQLLLPVALLVRSRTTAFEMKPMADRKDLKFGWQMYAASPLPYTYRGLDADGRAVELDPSAELGALRGRMLYDADTLRAMCDRHPEVVRIEWTDVVHRCR